MNSNEDYKLILGDYNCTLNHRLDSRGYDTDPHKKCRQRINQWLENGTCCDTYRDFHPNKVGYTFRTKNLKKQARLDYILTSPQLISKVKEIKNVPQTCTDHSSIIMSSTTTTTKTTRYLFINTPSHLGLSIIEVSLILILERILFYFPILYTYIVHNCVSE